MTFSWLGERGAFTKISVFRGRSPTSPQPFVGSFHRLLHRGRESLFSQRMHQREERDRVF
jgi:hypothetical protein